MDIITDLNEIHFFRLKMILVFSRKINYAKFHAIFRVFCPVRWVLCHTCWVFVIYVGCFAYSLGILWHMSVISSYKLGGLSYVLGVCHICWVFCRIRCFFFHIFCFFSTYMLGIFSLVSSSCSCLNSWLGWQVPVIHLFTTIEEKCSMTAGCDQISVKSNIFN